MPTCSENANTNNFFDLLDNGIKILIFSYLWISLLELKSDIGRRYTYANIDYKGLRCIRWLSYLLKIKHNKINIPLQIDNKYKIGDIPDILAFFWNRIKIIEELITICKKKVLDDKKNVVDNKIIRKRFLALYNTNYSLYVVSNLYLYSKGLKVFNSKECWNAKKVCSTFLMIINDGYHDTKDYNKTINEYKEKNIDLKTVLTSDGGITAPNKTRFYKSEFGDIFGINIRYRSILRAFDKDFNNHNSNCESDSDSDSDSYSESDSVSKSESDSDTERESDSN
jgi:hypothetical protein